MSELVDRDDVLAWLEDIIAESEPKNTGDSDFNAVYATRAKSCATYAVELLTAEVGKRQHWLCGFGFHRWGKWLRTEVTIVGVENGGYQVTHQERYCIGCNRHQMVSYS